MLLERMRQCRLNFAKHRYDCEAGIVGEHNATELIITPPAIMPDEAVYRLCFEPGGVSEIIPKMSDGTLAYPLPAAVTATAFCCMTLIGYIGNEQVYKSRMVQLHFCRAADGDADIDPQQPGIVAEVNRNTAARHTHENKPVLDKFAETDGKPTYDGKALGGGGGAGDFIIKMTVEANGDNYTVTSCDKTVEQIDAAFNADKNIVLTVAPEDGLYYVLSPVYAAPGLSYLFESFYDEYLLSANVDKRDGTTFFMTQMSANAINYSNDAMPTVTNVQQALDELVPKSHTHSNKDTLDKLSDSNGKLQYNGSDISVTKNGVINALGYTPQAVSTQVTTGSNITLADNAEYRLTNVTTLTLTYPAGNFECWMCLTFAASGTITVTLPADTKYIGTAPDFKNGETWELSFKDKVLAAQKVGEGT